MLLPVKDVFNEGLVWSHQELERTAQIGTEYSVGNTSRSLSIAWMKCDDTSPCTAAVAAARSVQRPAGLANNSVSRLLRTRTGLPVSTHGGRGTAGEGMHHESWKPMLMYVVSRWLAVCPRVRRLVLCCAVLDEWRHRQRPTEDSEEREQRANKVRARILWRGLGSGKRCRVRSTSYMAGLERLTQLMWYPLRAHA